jgi:hypothetical protein
MREETSRDNGAGVAGDIIISDIQTSLIISGSSVSSKGSETSEAHIVEPLTNRSNNSGSSFESRTLRRKFQRPSLYILRCQREEGGDPGDAPGQRGTKRILSDEDRSSSEDEAPSRRDAHVRSLAVHDSGAVPPWPRGPDPRGCNNDSSDDDYKPDPVDIWSLRQRQLGKTDPRGDPGSGQRVRGKSKTNVRARESATPCKTRY